MRRKMFFALFWLALAALAACGWGCSSSSSEEAIIFQNRTSFNGIAVYVDDVEKGTVDSGNDLALTGDFQGQHKFHAVHGTKLWGPTLHELVNGETFVFRIE